MSGQRVERNLASARAARWNEEVNLLDEEMKRTVRFFAYETKIRDGYWRAAAAETNLSHGKVAYWKRFAE